MLSSSYRFVEVVDEILVNLIQGSDRIVKIPFKPKRAERYYFVNKYGEVGWESWVDEIDYYRFNAKNCFRTEEEITEEDIERIVTEMKSKYKTE